MYAVVDNLRHHPQHQKEIDMPRASVPANFNKKKGTPAGQKPMGGASGRKKGGRGMGKKARSGY
jgi:hypothetical protein